jgi:hypothetical protein
MVDEKTFLLKKGTRSWYEQDQFDNHARLLKNSPRTEIKIVNWILIKHMHLLCPQQNQEAKLDTRSLEQNPHSVQTLAGLKKKSSN